MPNQEFIYKVVVLTLAAILVAVISILLIGLFDPLVDNKEVFKIIGPAFQTVVGAFVGIICGREIGKRE